MKQGPKPKRSMAGAALEEFGRKGGAAMRQQAAVDEVTAEQDRRESLATDHGFRLTGGSGSVPRKGGDFLNDLAEQDYRAEGRRQRRAKK